MFLDLAEASRIISERHTRLHALLPRLRSTSQLLEERENRFRIRSRVGSNILKIVTAAQKLFYLRSTRKEGQMSQFAFFELRSPPNRVLDAL